jgi:hypothetical protein
MVAGYGQVLSSLHFASGRLYSSPDMLFAPTQQEIGMQKGKEEFPILEIL